MLTVSQGDNAWDGGDRDLSSSCLVSSSDRALSIDKNWPDSCMFTASFFILALHALVGQFIHSVYWERCGGGARGGGARGGGARSGGARGVVLFNT